MKPVGLSPAVTFTSRGPLKSSYKLNLLFPVWGPQTLMVLQRSDGEGLKYRVRGFYV